MKSTGNKKEQISGGNESQKGSSAQRSDERGMLLDKTKEKINYAEEVLRSIPDNGDFEGRQMLPLHSSSHTPPPPPDTRHPHFYPPKNPDSPPPHILCHILRRALAEQIQAVKELTDFVIRMNNRIKV